MPPLATAGAALDYEVWQIPDPPPLPAPPARDGGGPARAPFKLPETSPPKGEPPFWPPHYDSDPRAAAPA